MADLIPCGSFGMFWGVWASIGRLMNSHHNRITRTYMRLPAAPRRHPARHGPHRAPRQWVADRRVVGSTAGLRPDGEEEAAVRGSLPRAEREEGLLL